MSEETNPINPADLHLPRDYEEDLDYRQPKPIINSTDTSDDEEKIDLVKPHLLIIPLLITLILQIHLRF